MNFAETNPQALPVRHIWEIHTLIPKPDNENERVACQMSVLAEHINQVWEYIYADRMDERTEIVAIIRREPVVAVLPEAKNRE